MRPGATLSAAAVLAEPAAHRPEHPAVVAGAERVTYRHLWDAARRYAAVLRDRGVGPGDRVALLLDNAPHFPAAYFATLALGATVVPVNALLRAPQIDYVLRDSGAGVLLCSADHLAEGAPAARTAGAELLTLGTGAVAPGGAPPKPPAPAVPSVSAGSAGSAAPALDALAAEAAPVPGSVPRAPEDLAVVLYTSGTTGRPKGAMLTHLNLVLNVTTTMLSPFAVRPHDILYCCLPLFHTFGQVCAMGTCFRAGATLVLAPRFDARRALAEMSAERCTVFMGVPTMYQALCEAAADTPHRPPLDRAFSGGAALPTRTHAEFQRTFDCPIYEGYGLTETSPVVAYNQPGRPRRPGTVGWPIWGVEVGVARAAATDRIELLPDGEVGEVVVRGHNVMAGYLGRPEATAAALVDGWFRTGDLGVREPDGCLRLVDRTTDLVIRGGYNVYPREVEETLSAHPAVARVAVIGVPDERYGQEVCAVVVPTPEARGEGRTLATDIVAWSRARLAAYAYPRRVEFVDTLPLGPSGKVLKRELVARFAGGTGERPAE